jgi:hypothetical protein
MWLKLTGTAPPLGLCICHSSTFLGFLVSTQMLPPWAHSPTPQLLQSAFFLLNQLAPETSWSLPCLLFTLPLAASLEPGEEAESPVDSPQQGSQQVC